MQGLKEIEKKDNKKESPDTIVGAYLREIGQYPVLTREEEQELGKKIKAGDGKAKEKMIMSNLKLVVSIAKQNQSPVHRIPLMDLIQEGNIGLMKAIDKFDWDRGYKFSTYATWWIRQTICIHINTQSRIVRLPTHVIDNMNKVRNAYWEIYDTTGEIPTTKKIAEEVGMDEKKINELMVYIQGSVSLDQPVSETEDVYLKDYITDIDADVEADVMMEILKEEIVEIMDTLRPRDREIIKMRFGFDGYEPMTLQQIGDVYGVSREGIRKVESSIIRKIHGSPSKMRKLSDKNV